MGTRDEYVASMKSAFVTMGDKVVEALLISYMPFLAWPIFETVLDLAVDKIMKDLINNGEIGTFFIYIDFRVNEQGRKFSDAAMKNHTAQLSGTEEEKTNAEFELRKSFADFARLSS